MVHMMYHILSQPHHGTRTIFRPFRGPSGSFAEPAVGRQAEIDQFQRRLVRRPRLRHQHVVLGLEILGILRGLLVLAGLRDLRGSFKGDIDIRYRYKYRYKCRYRYRYRCKYRYRYRYRCRGSCLRRELSWLFKKDFKVSSSTSSW